MARVLHYSRHSVTARDVVRALKLAEVRSADPVAWPTVVRTRRPPQVYAWPRRWQCLAVRGRGIEVWRTCQTHQTMAESRGGDSH
jgi:hypothetical protein